MAQGFRPLCTVRGVVQGPHPTLPASDVPLWDILSLMAKMWAHFRGPRISPVVARHQEPQQADCTSPKPAGTFVSLSPTPTSSPESLPKQRSPPPFSGSYPGLHLHLVCLSPASVPSPAITASRVGLRNTNLIVLCLLFPSRRPPAPASCVSS